MKITIEIDDDEIIDLAKKIAGISRPFIAPPSSLPVANAPLMTPATYAARVSISTRKLDELLPEDVFVGKGKLRRVRVERADAALIAALGDAPADPVAALATAAAQRPLKKAANGSR